MELGTLGQTEASIPMSALLSLGIELVVCFRHCPACPECIGRCFWVPLVRLLFHRRSWAGTHPAEWLGPPSLRWLGSPACLCDRRCPCLSVSLSACPLPIPAISVRPSLSSSLQATRTMAMATAMARITPPTMGMVWPLQTLGKCLALTQMQTLVLRVAPVPIPFCPELTSA